MSETIHYLKVSRIIKAPSRISGPVTFETACGAAFRVGMAGADILAKVTCPECIKTQQQPAKAV